MDTSYIHVYQLTVIFSFVNRIGGVMITSSAEDRGFEPRSGQTKDYKLVFVASPLSTQH